ncbi:MAG: putative thioesterase [Leptolyngbyaceae cyanobacterium MAG.088]|nr:putative thioesterase [Leptolyngbyaceae cyanobacterium MAG.088]
MSESNPWVLVSQPNTEASLRLFCFSHAGAGASVFRLWGTHTSSDIEVYAVQRPGRENRLREKPIRDLPSLISEMHTGLLPYLDRPFICFGHSVGALICFEWVRHLRRQGCPLPLRLFLSGRQAPQIPIPLPWVHPSSDKDLKAELRSYGGTPEAVLQSNEFMGVYLPILRADLAINETYTYYPEKTLAIPISVFGGSQDHKVSIDSLDAWSKQTDKDYKLRLLPGGHLFIKDSAADILQAITDDLVTTTTC